MKNILVALELKDPAFTEKILDHIIPIAEAFQAKCWLIHIAAPEPEFVSYEVGPQYIREMVADDLREEHRAIQDYAISVEKRKVNCEGLMIQGPTEEMIIKEVDKLDIDLVVLGNKQHGFLYSTFVGSITDELIQDLDVPLFLVPK